MHFVGSRTHFLCVHDVACCRGCSGSLLRFKPSLDLLDSVTLGHLNEGKPNNGGFSIAGLFGASAPDSKQAGDRADVCIIINATCVELPNVQQYIVGHESGTGTGCWVWGGGSCMLRIAFMTMYGQVLHAL